MEHNKQMILRNGKILMEQYLFVLNRGRDFYSCTLNSILRTVFFGWLMDIHKISLF